MVTTKKTEIIRERLTAEFDKNKNIVLKSIKIFANDKTREDKAILTRAQVNELRATKNRAVFLSLLSKKFDVVAKLKCDAQAKKHHLCKNTAYCVTADKVSQLLNNDAVKYVNRNAIKKTVIKKAAQKKAIVKKTVKAKKALTVKK